MIKLFSGDDTFRSRQALEAHIAGRAALELDENAWETLGRQAGLFVSKNAFVIRRAFENPPRDAAHRLEKLRHERETPYLFWEAGSPSPAVKKLFRREEQEEYQALKPKEALIWLNEIALERGLRWGKGAREQLVKWFGNDSGRLWNEFQKLAAFLYPAKEISQSDMVSLLEPPASSAVFELLEAALGRDRGRAASLLLRERAAGTDDFQLLGLLVGELRLALLVEEAFRTESVRFASLAERLRIHPFRVKKALAVQKKFSAQDLTHAFARCFSTDLQIKQGRLEPAAAIEALILSL